MKLKVTIEKDGKPFTDEIVVDEDIASEVIHQPLQTVLLKAGLIVKEERIQILDSDEIALLNYAG
jgi:hypothetical protein|tara:strand:+ start:549 stop:743 length:195 start_codon:yes stop_codon:yes gene_type:complete